MKGFLIMPKHLFKRYLPEHHKIKNHKHLRFFGRLLHEENLWHLNRVSTSRAFAIGLFAAFMPIPFQMVLAAALAILWRANLPVSVVLVWITNPVTMPPIFYFAYKVGAIILRTPPHAFNFEPSWQWLSNKIDIIWEPLLLGSLVCGIISAIIGYFAIQLFWRLWIMRAWHRRKFRRNK